MELTEEQVRVLGCLVEKQATTPEHYPLTTNALTLACNQKNNRDPVVIYPDRLVDQVMLELREAGLARTVHAAGARVPKHKHVLDEAWGLSPEQLAVLAVLLLRGPNTVHELLVRTERYVALPDDDAVAAVVASLTRLEPPLVVELPRQAGQREARFTHLLLGTPAEGSGEPAPAAEPASPRHDPLADEVAELRARLADLEHRFEELLLELGEGSFGS